MNYHRWPVCPDQPVPGVKITVDMPKVRDVVRLVERNGCGLIRTRGSHRQFRHAENPGTVTNRDTQATI